MINKNISCVRHVKRLSEWGGRISFFTFLAVFMSAQCFASSAVLADSEKDLETIAKVVGFVNDGPRGDVVLDVLYDPNDQTSVAHADEIVQLMSGGIVGSKVKLNSRKVSSVSDVTSKIVFITKGAGRFYDSALQSAVGGGLLTVSTDEECLGKGCVLVVHTYPSVDIIVSSEAADKVGVEFALAFSMMITKR